jgi:hypothetical protein
MRGTTTMLSRRSARRNSWLTPIAAFTMALMAAALAAPVARAQTFNTASGASVGDGPVDATATFSINSVAHQITITIRDLEVNPTSVGQTVNGVNFSLSNSTTAGSFSSQTGMQRTVNGTGAGQYTSAGNSSSAVTGSLLWNYYGGQNSDGHSTPGIVEVTSLGNHAATPTIIGDPSGSNAYSNGNGSITGNHNPFLAGTVTLVLNISGITGSTTISRMNFLFGTGEGEGSAPGVVDSAPEPSTIGIAGLGALGFIGFGLRRRLKK